MKQSILKKFVHPIKLSRFFEMNEIYIFKNISLKFEMRCSIYYCFISYLLIRTATSMKINGKSIISHIGKLGPEHMKPWVHFNPDTNESYFPENILKMKEVLLRFIMLIPFSYLIILASINFLFIYLYKRAVRGKIEEY